MVFRLSVLIVNDDLNYVINENEAQIIRKIFDMADNGSGYGEIMSRLNELGYKTKRVKLLAKIHCIVSYEILSIAVYMNSMLHLSAMCQAAVIIMEEI